MSDVAYIRRDPLNIPINIIPRVGCTCYHDLLLYPTEQIITIMLINVMYAIRRVKVIIPGLALVKKAASKIRVTGMANST